ncbi:MAG: hypothetical protein Q9222_001925 [Ikaeria aurantiellina]
MAIDSLALPSNLSQILLSHPHICSDQPQTHVTGGSALDDTNTTFQPYDNFFSLSSEPALGSEDCELSSLTRSFSTPQLDSARHSTGCQPQDSLEAALRLMRQLSCSENHQSGTASLTLTGHDDRSMELSQLPALIDKNKRAMEAVHSTLHTTFSHDGYLLVVVCLVVSKVLSTYASAVRMSCAHEHDMSLTSSSSASSTTRENKGPIAAQRVLDELYQIQTSMDQLGAKMQQWAKRNRASSNKAFPIGNGASQSTLAGFPFSSAVLNQLYTEVRKRPSTLSLELIDELRRYWS